MILRSGRSYGGEIPERFRIWRPHMAPGGSLVTWTLTPTSTGTHLRMEQSGFRPDQQQAYQGAKYGWQKFLANLEQALARID